MTSLCAAGFAGQALLALMLSLEPGPVAEPSSSASPPSSQEATEAGATEGDGGIERGFLSALRSSTFGLSLNYRVEWVDESDSAGPVPDEALASTLRTVLSISTGEWNRLSAHVAAEDVTAIGNDLYNNRGAGSLNNGRTDRSVVADPENTEISEAYLQIRIGEDGRARLGRQSLNLDQQRFVGAVGWRQNHQEFDAATLDAAAGSWRIRAGYLDRVHTVTGAQIDLDTPFVEAAGKLGPIGLVAHGLWLDDVDGRINGGSRATLGLRAHTSLQQPSSNWSLEAAFARQSDHADQTVDLDLHYFRLAAGLRHGIWNASLGAEVLEGDGRQSFQTPLATLHKFNGFADRFLATPRNGLQDIFVGFGLSQGAWRASLTLHDFEADEGGGSYGDEIDLVTSWKSSWGQTFALKAAHFAGDDLTRDTTKVMVWTTWSLP